MKSKKIRMIFWTLTLLALAAAALVLFVNGPRFGRQPRGARLERIEQSPNYRNGQFHNRRATPMLTSGHSRWRAMAQFLFGRKPAGLRPAEPIPALKTHLHTLPAQGDRMVWFGHSSYLLRLGGMNYLVDPVFCAAAPVSLFNRPFAGTEIYRPEDMPQIDYLVITHDHWDHLDYHTVRRLRDRIRRVICPLGVGEHLERWGFAPEQLIEMDWDQTAPLDAGAAVHCLPSRHFSGRGLRANGTLWASFLLETPSRKVYIGGDGGYDERFAQIGERFADIDLAIMENGQYNDHWRYIHLMPGQMPQAARELGAAAVVTVHHSKYALARHPWDEPQANERQMQAHSLRVLTPRIGEVIAIGE